MIIITKEKNQAIAELRELGIKIQALKQEWNTAGATGASNFNKIDAELKESVRLHTQLTQKVTNLTAALSLQANSAGISKGIAAGFNGLEKSVCHP